MRLEEIVKDRKLILKLLSVGTKILEEDNLHECDDNKVKNLYIHFFNRVLGSKFVKDADYVSFPDCDEVVIAELIFLKFNEEEFLLNYEFNKHEDLMNLEGNYNYLKERIADIDKKIRKVEEEKDELESFQEHLFKTWLEL